MRALQYTLTALITIGVLALGVGEVWAQTSWYDSSWTYRQKITIDSAQVDSNLSNFPVYVDLSDMGSDFFSNVKSNGGDIRVTKSDGTTEVAREVVSVDTASSTGELHFKADSIDSSSDTEFYIYYGNGTASNYADSDTYGTHNVWSNSFEAVYHMGDDPSGGTLRDSTSNNNDGSFSGSMSSSDVVDGLMGDALSFDGVDDEAVVPDDSTLDLPQEFLISGLIKTTGLNDTEQSLLIDHANFQSAGWNILHNGQYGDSVHFRTNSSGNNDDTRMDESQVNDGQWHSISGRRRSSGGGNYRNEIYDDGSIYHDAGGEYEPNTDADLNIGNFNGDAGGGVMDEVRIASDSRTSDWVSVRYTNQDSPSTLYTVGSQESSPGSGGGMASANYAIERDSLNAGGLDVSSSSNYAVKDTVGEQGVGEVSSSNYTIRAGYRQMAESSISVSVVSDFSLDSIGGLSGGVSEAVRGWNVTTDSPSGYEMKVRAGTSPALQSSTDSFADYSAGSDPDFSFSIGSSESAFGFTPEGLDIVDEYRDDGSNCSIGSQDTSGACWRGFSTTNETVASDGERNDPSGATTSLRFRAESGSNNVQDSGNYQATITVTGVAI